MIQLSCKGRLFRKEEGNWLVNAQATMTVIWRQELKKCFEENKETEKKQNETNTPTHPAEKQQKHTTHNNNNNKRGDLVETSVY